jgi:hypothetical protein
VSFILALLVSALSAAPSLPLHPPAQAVPSQDASPEAKAAKKPRKRRTTKRQDKFDIIGPLLSEVGKELAEIVGGDPEGVFLYVEVGRGWAAPSVFQAQGKHVRSFPVEGSELADLLFEVWRMEPPELRWSVMEYDVKDRRFAVAFFYPEEVDVEVIDDKRLKAALRARFGDKPVVYPAISRPGT